MILNRGQIGLNQVIKAVVSGFLSQHRLLIEVSTSLNLLFLATYKKLERILMRREIIIRLKTKATML